MPRLLFTPYRRPADEHAVLQYLIDLRGPQVVCVPQQLGEVGELDRLGSAALPRSPSGATRARYSRARPGHSATSRVGHVAL